MPQVSARSWLSNTHTILVFLCRRAVVLVALLCYNGPHSGFSQWQQAVRNHGPGLWLPLPLVYSTHTNIWTSMHIHVCGGGCEFVYDLSYMFLKDENTSNITA